MTRFRIYTENKNRDRLEILVASKFDSFTIFDATGYWLGCKESSLIIEILEQKHLIMKVKEIALEIKHLNEQEAVLVTHEKIEGDLI